MTERQASAPTFVLGLGAQKAGTSWLWHYLSGRPDCAMGKLKEFQFFNMLYAEDRNRGMITRQLKHLELAASRRVKMARNGRAMQDGDRFIAQFESIAMQFEPWRYADYFKRQIAARPEARLIGDITPEYATLSDDGYGQMATHLEQMGYPVKIVYLMRDPVARAFSAARMKERNVGLQDRKMKKLPTKSFFEFATRSGPERHGRYDQTITSLERHFSPDQIFYGIYEDFFCQEETDRLCDFLGIERIAADHDTRRNAAKDESAAPDPVQAAKVRKYFASTYAFCRERFGEERIDRLWTPEPEGNLLGLGSRVRAALS